MPRFKIQTLNNISAKGLERLPLDRYTIAKEIDRPDAILVRSHDMHATPIATSVKAIARAGTGTNNIPVAEMSRRGLPVFNAPGANANAVKELVLAALLISARNIVPALQFVSGLAPGEQDFEARVEEGKKQFAGVELPYRVLGIVGLGAIGALVADTAFKLGMKVIGYDPEITVDAAWRLHSGVRKANSIEELLKQSDFVSLHVPLVPATRGLIDARRLAAMRPGSVLLNFARDAIVDDAAVVEALRSGRLKAYLSDFPSPALAGVAGAIALPHLGASTAEAEENCAVMVVEQLREFLESGGISNAVNFPNVEMARESDHRISIANANVPNMLGQISTAMANAGLNIHNMVNKSRGEMAYTLVDVDSPVPQAAIDAIAAIDGVLSVRSVPADPERSADSAANRDLAA
jgi:D-3-phosphoglycerate dehydrogenase / 2-oxoglutarate reductase